MASLHDCALWWVSRQQARTPRLLSKALCLTQLASNWGHCPYFVAVRAFLWVKHRYSTRTWQKYQYRSRPTMRLWWATLFRKPNYPKAQNFSATSHWPSVVSRTRVITLFTQKLRACCAMQISKKLGAAKITYTHHNIYSTRPLRAYLRNHVLSYKQNLLSVNILSARVL